MGNVAKCFGERKAEITRKTLETDVSAYINLDGRGDSDISTGIGFLDHMLVLFSRHGFVDLQIKAVGDIMVDAHHTVEDAGIVLGQALARALADKKSIKRYGTSFVPMDEALVMVSIDVSGRPFLVYDVPLLDEGNLGGMDSQLIEEFFRAVAFNAAITLHIKSLYGKNKHHIAEAVFKAFGRALDEAKRIDERIIGVMSTKGVL